MFLVCSRALFEIVGFANRPDHAWHGAFPDVFYQQARRDSAEAGRTCGDFGLTFA